MCAFDHDDRRQSEAISLPESKMFILTFHYGADEAPCLILIKFNKID